MLHEHNSATRPRLKAGRANSKRCHQAKELQGAGADKLFKSSASGLYKLGLVQQSNPVYVGMLAGPPHVSMSEYQKMNARLQIPSESRETHSFTSRC